MFEKKMIIVNKSGLHARPAANLVELAKKYKSTIKIITDTKTIDAKSIISILTGELKEGTSITLHIEGEDELEAGNEIVRYIEKLEPVFQS